MKIRLPAIATIVAALIVLGILPARAGMPAPDVPIGATGITRPYDGPTQSCVQKTRGILYSNISNERYPCLVEGRKLKLVYMGLKFPAPEGTYERFEDGRRMFAGKGGHVLYYLGGR